jgi:hypothetical protein
MKTINELFNIGFKYAGKWVLENNTLDFILENYSDSENILYAFVVDNNIMYIGKSNRTLYKRMYNYKKNEKSQSTNIKNCKNIFDCLINKKEVNIYVFVDHGLLYYDQYKINLSAGLEDSIIKVVQPEWNDLK